MKKFIAIGWVHPKRGGDDYPFELKLETTSKKHFKSLVKQVLAKRSACPDDFQIKEVK